MKLKCDYCESFISDTDEKCPFCGAPNNHLAASAKGVPKTISELLEFCNTHKIPYEKMRFFIGKDYKEPRAFGIYKDENNDFVVYKNKSDGSRAIRYQGKDEAYAVNEIYQKMRSELSERKEAHPENIKNSSFLPNEKQKKRNIRVKIAMGLITVFIMFIISGFVFLMLEPKNGYYTYKGNQYYRTSNNWYIYDNGWMPYIGDKTFTDDIKEYWNGTDYNESYNADSFENSPYYEQSSSGSNYNDNNKNWDSDDWDDDDWNYDYDNWDSNDTNWDSDW